LMMIEKEPMMCMVAGIISQDGNVLPQSTVELVRNLIIAGDVRGGHSAGFSVLYPNGHISTWKRVGNPKDKKNSENIAAEVDPKFFMNAVAVLVHNRYASRGIVNEKNAHPHTTKECDISAIHNGTFSYNTLAALAHNNGVYGRLSVNDSRAFFTIYTHVARKIDNRTKALYELVSDMTTFDPHVVCVMWKNRIIISRYNRPLFGRSINHDKVMTFASTDAILTNALKATYPDRDTLGKKVEFKNSAMTTIALNGEIKEWSFMPTKKYERDVEKLRVFGRPRDFDEIMKNSFDYVPVVSNFASSMFSGWVGDKGASSKGASSKGAEYDTSFEEFMHKSWSQESYYARRLDSDARAAAKAEKDDPLSSSYVPLKYRIKDIAKDVKNAAKTVIRRHGRTIN